MDNASSHTWKSFSYSMDRSSGGEGKQAPSDGKRADDQAYERAVSMKNGIGFEGQIGANAEAAEKGEER